MSMKRGQSSSKSFGGSDPGGKVGRDELHQHLTRLGGTGAAFSAVDLALVLGAGEPQVARALIGLASEGCLEKIEAGKYRVTDAFKAMKDSEFAKAFTRASKTDGVRAKEVGEIARLKLNNDTMRGRLLQAVAERDHYLAALKSRGIDPGPPPAPVALPAVTVTETPASEEPTVS